MIPIILRDFCNQIIKIHFIVNYNLAVDQFQTLEALMITIIHILVQAMLDHTTLDQTILDRDMLYLRHHRQQLRQLALAGET
jgi:hypothetical protein